MQPRAVRLELRQDTRAHSTTAVSATSRGPHCKPVGAPARIGFMATVRYLVLVAFLAALPLLMVACGKGGKY
jgi:hypothetical protein